jgi:hypothetical protein
MPMQRALFVQVHDRQPGDLRFSIVSHDSLLSMINRTSYPKLLVWAALPLLLQVSIVAAPSDAAPKKVARNYLVLKVYDLLNNNDGYIGDGVNNYRESSESVNNVYSGVFEVKSDTMPIMGSDPFHPVFLPCWRPIKDVDLLQVDAERRLNSRSLDLGEGNSRAITTRNETWTAGARVSADLNGTDIVLNPDKHRYDVHVRLNLRGLNDKIVSHSLANSVVGDPSLGGGLNEQTNDMVNLPSARCMPYTMIDIKDQPLPKDAAQLSGQQRLPHGDKGTYLVSWNLIAVVPPPELVITSSDYPEWLPTVTPGPVAGTPLQFTAELRDANGERPTVKVKRFEWELVETSREPGIAMNYPIECKDDKTPDMKFELGSGQTSTDPELQKFIEADPKGYVTRGKILPFDWGAWSTLKVRAILDDDRVIEGKYQDSDEPVRLPLRKADSYIADKWKKLKGVSNAADTDDDDPSPQGDDHKGDGFSLYEEYRGWIVNGKHEDGDPKVKDYFVLNRVGSTAVPGLTLFAQLTGLSVHYDLKEDEMRTSADLDVPGPDDRVMNGNRTAKSPRKASEPQHGVVLIKADHGSASEAVTIHEDDAFKPKNFKYVVIETGVFDDDGLVAVTREGGRIDYMDELSSTIAHELGHTVGLHHHGETDLGMVKWHRLTNASGVGISYVEIDGAAPGVPIEVYHEATQTPVDPAVQRGFRSIWVGVKQGQHSGQDNCIMRYDISKAFIPEGHPSRRYLVEAPFEGPGAVLCEDGKGTGVNDHDRNPMPRYGDAAVGDCKHQICVRDDAP